MKECLNLIDQGMAGLKAQDPDIDRFEKANKAVQDAISCYKNIYYEKKRSSVQSSLDKYGFLLDKRNPTPKDIEME